MSVAGNTTRCFFWATKSHFTFLGGYLDHCRGMLRAQNNAGHLVWATKSPFNLPGGHSDLYRSLLCAKAMPETYFRSVSSTSAFLVVSRTIMWTFYLPQTTLDASFGQPSPVLVFLVAVWTIVAVIPSPKQSRTLYFGSRSSEVVRQLDEMIIGGPFQSVLL